MCPSVVEELLVLSSREIKSWKDADVSNYIWNG